MSKSCKIAAILGMGVLLAPWALTAQAPAAQLADAQAPATAAPAAIPPDQQATKEQLAKLFEVMRVREQLASVTKIMPALMQQQMSAQFKQMQKEYPGANEMSDEQQQAMSKVMGKFMGKVMDLYTPDEMIADMATVYRRHLSRTDVDGMIAFYSSPAGQHMVEMQPVIMKEYMPMVMQHMQERMKPLIDEMSKEMQGVATGSATSSPHAKKSVTK